MTPGRETTAPAKSIGSKSVWARFFRSNGLTLTMLGLFAIAVAAQAVTGLHAYNNERNDFGRGDVGFGQYLTTGHFIEAIGENWESEFLQMGVFIYFAVWLYQKGSPESKDPDHPDDRKRPVTKDSPWPVRRGGWALKVYENSLTLAFLLLFLASFVVHLAGGARKQSDENALIGKAEVTWMQFLGDSEFWFESFQNWQSEFLSIGAMVYLSVFFRQRGSPESKPVEASHRENE